MLTTNGWTRYPEEIDGSIFPIMESFFDQEGGENDSADCEDVRWEHTESSKNSQGQNVPVCYAM